MHLSPDEIIFWQHGFFKLNATIVFTWGLMFVLVIGSILITRKLSTGLKRSRWQNLLEILVTGIKKQMEEVGLSPDLLTYPRGKLSAICSKRGQRD
jgi:F-type H+-transporting ATPase subunit a